MSILNRISLIVRSNLSSLLEKAEDPEQLLDQLISDMSKNLREIKLQISRAKKDEKLISEKVKGNRDLAAEYEKKAISFLGKDDDDSAKDALRRKKRYSTMSQSLAVELEEQGEAIKLLETNFNALEVKIEEAKNEQQILLARKKRAENRLDLSDTLDVERQDSGILGTLGKMAEKVAKTESWATAMLNLEKAVVDEEIAQIGMEKELSEELAQLKSQSKKKKK